MTFDRKRAEEVASYLVNNVFPFSAEAERPVVTPEVRWDGEPSCYVHHYDVTVADGQPICVVPGTLPTTEESGEGMANAIADTGPLLVAAMREIDRLTRLVPPPGSVTITSGGAPVVFLRAGSGYAAALYPGPTAFGDTPEEAFAEMRRRYPDWWERAEARPAVDTGGRAEGYTAGLRRAAVLAREHTPAPAACEPCLDALADKIEKEAAK